MGITFRSVGYTKSRKNEYKEMEAFSRDMSLEPLNLDYYVHLKKKWQVSIGTMVMRVFNLGIISSEDYQKSCKDR
ncbi:MULTISPECIES: hypothetical protein [Bacillus]|uniref:hypothetical protein n=1 Tax=Bacillus TaxID=1386 RepID=UPI00103E30AE|nr:MULTISPECIES: hypothetical protein [Bacillus]TCD35109.1 hypothetical protein E0D84_01235 [Bacillus wiedmannii]